MDNMDSMDSMDNARDPLCLVGLGSNLGRREETIKEAWRRIAAIPGTQAVALGPFHETEPVGGPVGQPLFLNTAATLRTSLQPIELLRHMLRIESELGRVRLVHWGPRTIDLDLLLFGDLVIESPELTVPHPRMHLRRFVLEPAADIAADVVHPVLLKSVADMLRDLDQNTDLNQNTDVIENTNS